MSFFTKLLDNLDSALNQLSAEEGADDAVPLPSTHMGYVHLTCRPPQRALSPTCTFSHTRLLQSIPLTRCNLHASYHSAPDFGGYGGYAAPGPAPSGPSHGEQPPSATPHSRRSNTMVSTPHTTQDVAPSPARGHRRVSRPPWDQDTKAHTHITHTGRHARNPPSPHMGVQPSVISYLRCFVYPGVCRRRRQMDRTCSPSPPPSTPQVPPLCLPTPHPLPSLAFLPSPLPLTCRPTLLSCSACSPAVTESSLANLPEHPPPPPLRYSPPHPPTFPSPTPPPHPSDPSPHPPLTPPPLCPPQARSTTSSASPRPRPL
jgi:hypothetical protein